MGLALDSNWEAFLGRPRRMVERRVARSELDWCRQPVVRGRVGEFICVQTFEHVYMRVVCTMGQEVHTF